MTQLHDDFHDLDRLTADVRQWCLDFIRSADDRPAAMISDITPPALAAPEIGEGAEAAVARFIKEVSPHLAAAIGPRYWGFVTGGVTPAALLGDWIAAAVDQNLSTPGDSIASALEVQTIEWLLDLCDLPDSFSGCLTTGATASNLLGIICGRQFAGQRQGVDIAAEGLSDVAVEVFSATPHASALKGMAIAGLGRKRLVQVARLADSEAMDVDALRIALENSDCAGKIVLASAGTVTGTDFDDLEAIADLCEQHGAWLHVDGAFGLFSRLLEDRRDWTRGLERADSITSDAHKWLNTPYDCGIFFCRHLALLQSCLEVPAPYLAVDSVTPSFMNLGIENSRRFRALPLWISLLAYGKAGVRRIVEDNCTQAERLAQWLQQSPDYELLKPAKLNVVVFRPQGMDDADVSGFLQRLNGSGEVFMTPGQWRGRSAIRAAFSNWRTTQDDVDHVCAVLERSARQ
ncbi:aminotransferase class V-fold PLP-dependent enzyme [Hahella sp. KA22]|uniref:pyridoxal phosphate-dependent decarboxylase family protein n=1 Tax=Hahella sp. KA22 TaxID=1628392 RepID=UPI000FDD3ECB|nr:aminotransferase class V-fold PLP-dependent enzyme [Hahella sp. KA22]AZZ90174.1 aspartate aminotransferase family protein [Hahella sp. KA22]QAY53544.1 aminotransferase class V-fold PLP-dependent enzyme [Hahella sp. KA22]